MQFICYKKCSTCRKAEKWLEEHGIKFEKREITEDIPTAEELKLWIPLSGKDSKKFFNTSGNVYRENKLKDKLPEMSEAEKLELLASNGMLIKRPLLVTEEKVLVGFKEQEYEDLLL